MINNLLSQQIRITLNFMPSESIKQNRLMSELNVFMSQNLSIEQYKAKNCASSPKALNHIKHISKMVRNEYQNHSMQIVNID